MFTRAADLSAGGSAQHLPLVLAVPILILTAKLLGWVVMRIGQPAVLGELMAGLLLGPTVLDMLSWPAFSGVVLEETIRQFGELGVLFLMFAAGLEIELEDLRQAGRPATLSGVLGVISPMLLGLGTALAFRFPVREAVFVGVVLSATSVSISAQTLLELGRLRSREGVALLGAAVIDDVLVIIILALFVVIAGGEGSAAQILLLVGRMVLILALVSAVAVLALPAYAEWSMRLRVSQGLLAFVLAAVLLLAWFTEAIGQVAAITGAFIAGVGLQRSHLRDEIERGLRPLAYAFFVPLFLVNIGLQANVRALDASAGLFAAALIGVAVVSKMLGSGLGAWLGGFDRGSAFRMGVGMISRGEVGLIVASVGVTEGFMQPALFTTVVLMVVATTMVTPPFLRAVFAGQEVPHAAAG